MDSGELIVLEIWSNDRESVIFIPRSHLGEVGNNQTYDTNRIKIESSG